MLPTRAAEKRDTTGGVVKGQTFRQLGSPALAVLAAVANLVLCGVTTVLAAAAADEPGVAADPAVTPVRAAPQGDDPARTGRDG